MILEFIQVLRWSISINFSSALLKPKNIDSSFSSPEMHCCLTLMVVRSVRGCSRLVLRSRAAGILENINILGSANLLVMS